MKNLSILFYLSLSIACLSFSTNVLAKDYCCKGTLINYGGDGQSCSAYFGGGTPPKEICSCCKGYPGIQCSSGCIGGCEACSKARANSKAAKAFKKLNKNTATFK